MICSNVLTKSRWQEHKMHVRKQPQNTVYWSAVGAPHRRSMKSMWRRLPETLTRRRRTKNNCSFVIVDSIGWLEIQINILVNCELGRNLSIRARLPCYREQHTNPTAVLASHSCCLCHSYFPSIVPFFFYLFPFYYDSSLL